MLYFGICICFFNLTDRQREHDSVYIIRYGSEFYHHTWCGALLCFASIARISRWNETHTRQRWQWQSCTEQRQMPDRVVYLENSVWLFQKAYEKEMHSANVTLHVMIMALLDGITSITWLHSSQFIVSTSWTKHMHTWSLRRRDEKTT